MLNTVKRLYEDIQHEKSEQKKPPFAPMLRRIDTPMPTRVNEHPAGAYLISTQTPMSRATALSSLTTIARILGEKDVKSTPW
ncbi:MAG: hypothetical protein OXG72_12925, partial [Acidobacteria bacterium]|nr:hypothetical protein [Acidobacteriota bacterium]